MRNIDNRIRAYKESDFNDLLTAFQLNVPKYFNAKEEADFITFIKKKEPHFFVIEVQNKVVGCCGYAVQTNASSCKLSWVFCNPAYQGQGLGGLLVKYCIERIQKEHNIANIVVRTSQLASTFFSKFGFKLLYTKDNYWGKGLHLYYMKNSMR